ncbi:MAG: flagellar biosynthesis protein FliQ [Nitrospirae bacterium]|nr:flagellar biosynthesis protein FliQ [Nitrospirota bacterium]MBI3352046.1 flagellar biosynthesis protein FliQ [Nitrospirota bacterium]
MTPDFIVDLVQRTIETTLLVVAPVLMISLIAGLAVSLFQAVTQINESTLTFLPKILAVALALVIFMPWMMSVLVSFTTHMLTSISSGAG